MRFARVDRAFEAFQKVTSENAQHVIKAFGMQDCHIAVMYRIMNDMYRKMPYLHLMTEPGYREVTVNGEKVCEMVHVDADGAVDLKRYHEEFAAVSMIVYVFQYLNQKYEAAKTAQAVPAPTAEQGLISLPEFGGDNGATP